MYNSKDLQSFIEKVNHEASKAAQDVYNQYQAEFETMIKKQIKPNDTVELIMGSVFIENAKGERIAESMSDVLMVASFWQENVSAGFTIPTIK